MNIKFSRRRFLTTSAGALGAVAMPHLSRAADRPAVTHGVQSGDVTVDSGVVWARTDRPAQMLVEVATTESFRDARALPPIAALPDSDFTAKMLIENLPGGQDIFYRVRFRDLSHTAVEGEPVTGRFRTAPADRRDVSFVWGGDVAGQGWGINPDDGGMFTFSAMRKHRPDFFLHSGDTIYADGPIQSEVKLADGKIWKNVTIPEKAKVAETLDEYRAAHKYNFTDDNLRAFNAEVPIFVQWDDHEVTNNWSLSKELPATYKERDIALLAARASRAFHEMYPMRESIVEPGRVYRQISYGPHLDVFVLDERSYRGPNGPNLETVYDPASYFLGPDQIAWLKRGLLNSRATWKVIARHAAQPRRVRHAEGGIGSHCAGRRPGARPRVRDRRHPAFHQDGAGQQHRVAHGGRALRGRALLRSEQGAIPGFRAVLGVRVGPASRGHIRSERARQYVWAGGAFRQGARERQPEPAAIRRHAVLRSRQDRRRFRPDDGDLARPRRRRAVVNHARSEAGLTPYR